VNKEFILFVIMFMLFAAGLCCV